MVVFGNEINAIDLLGYNKVADNTFPNIVPMTVGKSANQLPRNKSLSDHGMRFGKIRETFVGKLEERLPLMLIVFPPWFLKSIQILRNLRINARRLTTPFDIFATLEHILDFNGIDKKEVIKKRSMSLLNEIPEDRTCVDADILPHWCTCSKLKTLDIQNKTVINVGHTIVSLINQDLKDSFDVCEPLYLKSIKHALLVIPFEKRLRIKNTRQHVIDRKVTNGDHVKSCIDYQITVQTKPGDAVFEATLRFDQKGKTYDLIGDFSRINKYGNQSHCIEDIHLKNFVLKYSIKFYIKRSSVLSECQKVKQRMKNRKVVCSIIIID
ncbi:Hypothetical predicted protein [Mytilus galloprovincialis]|uniref:Uncharacterized protein n=1 Tax=Mytilus galloprovincialis TaxID=29158 RepID=A0A8B6E372_MYTGA|nr:Hypothetical predicted protein [Mytilus galloprovincialis]